ncbi:MAG: hypothetical protein JRC88_11745, partial [Deltaproteobacteria bacterium]|nr:hypothetical protein [Deltaproteobacteria bacterium]
GIAKNLEVYFTGLESNTVKAFERYISLPLVRSWVGGTVLRSLPRDVPLRFDICCLRSSKPEEISFRFIQTPTALLRIKCVPNKKSKFKFEVKVIADNSKVTRAVIEIEHGV